MPTWVGTGWMDLTSSDHGADFVLCCIIIFICQLHCVNYFSQNRLWISIYRAYSEFTYEISIIWSLSEYHEFCEDDIDVEDIFRSTFGGSRVFYWSFINEENPHWGRSGNFSNYGKSWKWKHQSNNRYDSSTESESESESECLRSNSVSDRLALGLSASGPLKLEDVKIAWVVFLKMLQTFESSATGFYFNWILTILPKQVPCMRP